MISQPGPRPAPPTAVTCPTCGTANPIFNAKTEPELTYMRCLKCGEVWNAQRHVAPRRQPTRY